MPDAEGAGGRGAVRIGVLGSAFNPPHNGHLTLASEAAWRLGLDRVELIPTGTAPHKRIVPEPGAAVRLRMTELACEGDERLRASPVEVDRAGPSYTCETLRAIASQNPNAEITFLMGADAARQLESWHRPEEVVRHASVAVARRPGVDEAEVEAVLSRLGAADRMTLLEMPEIGISSSLVRLRAAEGRPLRYLVPEGVRGYIEREGIYA